jgi:KDO2-lipid IV(A) lauroyltransferase
MYLTFTSVWPYRKGVIDLNLERSFPDLTIKERKKIRRKFYRHFTDLLAEGIKNLTISKSSLSKRFQVDNPELMESLFKNGKNVILVSGHYNNWEWLISAQNFLFDHQAYGIGMPLTSKFWDKKINERRSRFGMRVINAKSYKDALSQNPSESKSVLVLSDQAPGDSKKSYWMNFLNQSTPVLFGAELIAHELNYTVVFFVTKKVKRGYYKTSLELISDDPRTMEWGQITEAHVKGLEKEINFKPEYWLWSHKRWKREEPDDLELLKKLQHEKFNSRFNYKSGG